MGQRQSKQTTKSGKRNWLGLRRRNEPSDYTVLYGVFKNNLRYLRVIMIVLFILPVQLFLFIMYIYLFICNYSDFVNTRPPYSPLDRKMGFGYTDYTSLSQIRKLKSRNRLMCSKHIKEIL